MSSYLHVLDGRIRIKIPKVRHDPCVASAMVQVLEKMAGVTYVRANTKTGNVLVQFDSQIIHYDQIIQSLKDMVYLTHPSTLPSSPFPLQEVGKKLIHLVVKSAVEKAVERVILTLI
jgi:copper chaperone CopZ